MRHSSLRIVRRSTQYPPNNVLNPQLPAARFEFCPLELDPAFPFDFLLDGRRDDEMITNLHVHDGLEIGYCHEGSGIYYIGSKILPYHAGDVTVITDREYHRSRSSPGTSSRWDWFFLNPLRLLVPHVTPSLIWEPERFSGPKFINVLSSREHPLIAQLMLQMSHEVRQSDAHVRPNLRALTLVFLNHLHRLFPKPKHRTKADHSARALSRISPALQLIVERFDQPLIIPDLATACSMSVRNFQLRFTKLMGCSPQAHLLKSRIQAAAALLADEERAISDIALSCGFNTLSSFNRAFKARHGMNPRDYRFAQRPA